jgi:multidrug transporter EmrE-like cation transporter
MYWFALLIAVISNAIANVAFKKAVARTPLEEGIGGFIKLAAEPWMWLGIVSACLLLGCYLYTLRGIDLSIAYPAVTGLAMLGIALAGTLIFGETISFTRIAAMVLIVAGVLLLNQSA